MKVREYHPGDFERIRQFISEGKFSFEFPDPMEPQVIVKECLVAGGEVRMAAFARLQANAYLLVDGEWKTPAERLEAMQILEFAMIEKGKLAGLDQVTAQVAPRFGRRLESLGWNRSIGETWNKVF